jgi:glycosyltransferase involved in cell wall biosynthesis
VRRQFDLAGHVVALSESWKRYLATITSKPITVIPNAVDVESFAFERDYALSGEIRLLLLGGVGLVSKGALELIEVVDALGRRNRLDTVRLTVVGHGEVEEVRRFVAERGLQSTVEVTGWVEKQMARKLLREADVFVLPSHVEGLPVSMLEAMASGLPAVVTPVGGIPEVVEDGINGLVVQRGAKDDLMRAIRRLLADEELRRRLGARARETVRARFDIRVAVARLKSLYLELAPASPPTLTGPTGSGH